MGDKPPDDMLPFGTTSSRRRTKKKHCDCADCRQVRRRAKYGSGCAVVFLAPVLGVILLLLSACGRPDLSRVSCLDYGGDTIWSSVVVTEVALEEEVRCNGMISWEQYTWQDYYEATGRD